MSSFWRRVNLGLALTALAVPALAGPYADLDARLQGRPDAEAKAALSKLAGDDIEAQNALEAGPEASRAYISLRATMEGAPATKPPAIATAGNERVASSWLARAFDRLHAPDLDLGKSSSAPVKVGPWLNTFMWGMLGLLAGFAVYLLARYVRLPGLRKKAKPIAPDEPLRSADAWLEEANALLAQGRFREAVRGLYVAGLMRMDEAGVARFDPHETNWEHLRRIEASPKRPVGSDVRSATSLFDRCWYGHLPSSAADVASMRAWYQDLVSHLAGVAAK